VIGHRALRGCIHACVFAFGEGTDMTSLNANTYGLSYSSTKIISVVDTELYKNVLDLLSFSSVKPPLHIKHDESLPCIYTRQLSASPW